MLMDDVTGNEDGAWNAIWESAGRITATGFEVEMIIPFSQLRFQAGSGPSVWGVDGVRSYPRRDRHHIGLFPRIRGENSYLGQEEKLVGFNGVRPGQNLEIVPTLTAVRADERADFPRGAMAKVRSNGDVGLSAKWGVTPNVTLNATFNPDFSQVEADQVQLNVNNQFALFFNETRPFFLEGADFFRVPRLNLLHTRQVVQPTAAAKISGKTGRHAFGFFSAQDETTSIILPGSQGSDTETLDADTLASVGRYRFDLAGNSTVGAMLTDRRGGGYANSVLAIDTSHRFSSADSFSGTLAYSLTEDAPSIAAVTAPGRRSGIAMEWLYSHSVRNWEASAEYGRYNKDFRADLGFITQVDYNRWEIAGSRTWHGDATRFYNRINASANVDETTEQDGPLIEREWEGYVSMNSRLESYVQVGGGTRKRLFNGVTFTQWFRSVYGEIRPSRDIEVGMNASWGDWIDFAHTRPAKQRNLRPYVDVNYGRHLAMRYTHIIDTLDVEGGRLFTAHVPELRFVYQRDTRTLLRAILQYTGVGRNPLLYAASRNRQSRDLFAQLLASYKVNAQTALYFGYSSGASGSDQFALTHANQTLFAKFSYAWLK